RSISPELEISADEFSELLSQSEYRSVTPVTNFVPVSPQKAHPVLIAPPFCGSPDPETTQLFEPEPPQLFEVALNEELPIAQLILDTENPLPEVPVPEICVKVHLPA
ncbi:MAG: hypothetical protein HY324_01845, partial [Chlamydiia bacterium]|nr:hypothetical protein [Chlamydiia bacterium]